MPPPCAAAEPNDTQPRGLTAALTHPLVLILLLAAACRLPLAFWPNFHHPDEIFQYLEPASRILGHDSIITWEWRYGVRSWLLPTIMAGPVAVGDWLAPGGAGAFIVPRLAAAIASLSIVASAWAFGARVSQTHAVLAGLVTAVWFELIYFAPHPLTEPLATALILPAALLLTRDRPTRRDLIGAGALLALAAVLRFQYAPAIATLVLLACWREWQRLLWLPLGGCAVLAVAGLVDAMHGAVPFGWLVANVRQNLVFERAADYGTMPVGAYGRMMFNSWSLAVVPIGWAIWQGEKRASLLFRVALVNLAFHSLVPHKEYRFIFLSITLLVLLAALGSADWIKASASPSLRRRAALLVAGSWIGISATLAAAGAVSTLWMTGVGAARLAAEVKADPQLCGLAIYNVPYVLLPGRSRLAGDKPLYAFYPADPLTRGDLAGLARATAADFNRIIAEQPAQHQLPAGFTEHACATEGERRICVFGRDGGCGSGAASAFNLNDVLVRADD